MKTLGYISYIVSAYMAVKFGDNHNLVCILFTVMAFDTLTGFVKSIRIGNTSSNKLKRGIVSKLFIIGTIFLTAHGIEDITGISSGGHGFKIVLSMLIVAEFISIIQKIIVIKTGEPIEEYDAITGILRWILEKARNFLEIMKGGGSAI